MAGTTKDFLSQLHDACGSVLFQSTTGEHEAKLSARLSLADELNAWNIFLCKRPEISLYVTAHTEIVAAFLSLCQGRYRNAFKSLRLALELYLQGLYLSVDEIATYEWLHNYRDTSWSGIIHAESGVFSMRYCRAFFPELDEKRKAFETMSRTLYRELSECTHGNAPASIIFSDQIEFSIDLSIHFYKSVSHCRLYCTFLYLYDS